MLIVKVVPFILTGVPGVATTGSRLPVAASILLVEPYTIGVLCVGALDVGTYPNTLESLCEPPSTLFPQQTTVPSDFTAHIAPTLESEVPTTATQVPIFFGTFQTKSLLFPPQT